ncbi:MAG TPA: hypothetical protein VEI54_00460, partial [Candidatus Limnocylindrales bacterium]|nr:hypothetical protein [Candidatus Limnocylindrales bacterium]
MIALYAGWASQKRFLSECPDAAWAADKAIICSLLTEMYPHDRKARSDCGARLNAQAEAIVSQHEKEIKALVTTLLSKPFTDLP